MTYASKGQTRNEFLGYCGLILGKEACRQSQEGLAMKGSLVDENISWTNRSDQELVRFRNWPRS